MNALLSEARAKVGHRLAMHLRVDDLPKRAVTAGAAMLNRDVFDRAIDQAQSNNGWLIFCGHDVAERPSHYGCPGLNALFAISGNSPLVSMVNFPCCVCSARFSGAPGVTRRVTPQPMRMAVQMEAGVDADL